MKCSGCNKNFANRDCFQKHFDDRICDLYKKCEDCGATYTTRWKRDARGTLRVVPHICNTIVSIYFISFPMVLYHFMI